MKRSFVHAFFAVIVAVCMCLVALAPAQGAGAAPITLPKQPKGLPFRAAPPASPDLPSPYAPQVSCSPQDMAGPRGLRDLVLKTYRVGGKGNIGRSCNQGVTEHSEGRAWDWMINPKVKAEKAAAADFLAWLTADDGANARRLGIMYVIYNKKIWAIYRVREGWRKSAGHTDHIHISFGWAGARANTSFWTGNRAEVDHGPCARFAGQPAVLRSTPRDTRCYSSASLVKRSKQATVGWGASSTKLKTAQKALKVKQTGRFDNTTWKAVKAYQKSHDLPWNGSIDQPTWTSLAPAEAKSDVAKGYTPAKAAAYGLKTYAKSAIAERATGKSVLMLQVALAMKRADSNGYFGPRTKAAVKSFQKKARLKQTGTVAKADWAALVRMRAAVPLP